MNYPETKCLNCEAVIPARTRKKQYCNNDCSKKYWRKKKWKNGKKYYQYQKRKKEERTIKMMKEAPGFSESWTSSEAWAKMYFKLGHDEMRKLAGLKTEEIRQAETVAELFALRKG